jgi:2-methylisocitrate lyase-like PEP mutase family enzyme
LSDLKQVERVVREVPLPLNLIAFPGAPSNRDWASAGAARISYGPFPLRELMQVFEEKARAAIQSVDG